MPAVSSDRRTYTFVLRKTFRFAPPVERTPRRANVPLLDRASALAEARLAYARDPSPRRSRRSAGVSRRAESARLGHPRPGRPDLVHADPALSGLPRAARASLLLPGAARHAPPVRRGGVLSAAGRGSLRVPRIYLQRGIRDSQAQPELRGLAPAAARRDRLPRGHRHGEGGGPRAARQLGRGRGLRPIACAGRNRRASLRRRGGQRSRIGRFHAL